MTLASKPLTPAPAAFTPAPLTTEQQQTITNLVLAGDLSKMDATARVNYYVQLCQSLSLNPHTQPFQILKFQGKEIMYATKSCTEQLRKQQGVSVTKLEHRQEGDVYLVVATVVDATGRTDVGTGAVPVTNMKGEALANAFMKAETKAKRRATLSICGLGMLDESELDTLPQAQAVSLPTSPDLGTSAEVVVESAAKPAAGNVAAATASTSPAPSATSALSAEDERKLAGHRTRFEYARSISEVQQIWQEAKRLQPHLVADKDAAKARLNKAAQQPAASDALVREFVEQPAIGAGPKATDAQRADLVHLLGRPTITDYEKRLLLPVVPQLDEVRAGQAIYKVLVEIARREGGDPDKGMRQALHRFIGNYMEQLGSSEVDRLTVLVEDTSQHWVTLRGELLAAKASLQAVPA